MNNLNQSLWPSSNKSFLGGKSLAKKILRKFEE